MPDNEALTDHWTCNTWQTQPGEQAAVDQAAYGSDWANDGWAAGDDEPPGDPMPSVDDRYQSLLADWPQIPSVISSDKHIDKHNTEAQKYWEEHWKPAPKEGKPPPEMQCADYARYQMYVVGCDAQSSSTGYQLYRRDTLVNYDQTVDGLNYAKHTLTQGMPVFVGVWLIEWEPDKVFNRDKTTNHFVVIVGMGKDDRGAYLLYYDSLNDTAQENRFCLRSNLEVRFCDNDGYSILAQIRKTSRR